MNIRRAAAAWILGIAVLLGGCAEPRIGGNTANDRAFGNAVRAAQFQQTLNPGPPRSRTAPQGLDGPAAKATIDRYQKSYESPPAPVNVYTIGVGSAGGAAP